MKDYHTEVGVVVIGRNEGERLKQCLKSVLNQSQSIVYVDSGSSDGSAAYAESLGLDVLRLDIKNPFSAARARNEGFQILIEKNKNLKYVQFLDGDCKCCKRWLSHAYTFLQDNSSCAVVSGRRKERFPEESIYNLLCDIEWNTPIGETETCGGDFMIRTAAFEQIGGFNITVVAGEEPEMCYRLRERNWLIFRLDHPMTLHDAAMTHFSQWWRRSMRAGHAYAQGFSLHFRDGKWYCFRESVRSWFWAFILPVCVLIFALFINIKFIFILIVYLIHYIRITLRNYMQLRKIKISIVYSYFNILGKWPEFIGQILFYKKKLLRKGFTIIEYS